MRFLRDDPGLPLRQPHRCDRGGLSTRREALRRGLSLAVADAETPASALRAEADETTQVPSIIEVFPGADWFERETYDLTA
jgi:NADH-quinone oxidoreductase subunit C